MGNENKMYSNWNVVDLHIHSAESNAVKEHDYEGKCYSARELLEKLLSYSKGTGMIFSVTDHDCINVQLYKDLENEIHRPEFLNRINYIIGVELDVYDVSVYEKVFHCLVFFDTKDLDIISASIDELFNNVELKQRDGKEHLPSIAEIFRVFQKNRIKDIILIPHYHAKAKGIPTRAISDELLNYLCFNAFEDANNINNITESLKIYLNSGYKDFPFVAFSDNHDLEIYPKAHHNDNNDHHKCYILSNINYPFTSIKTAFQEPRLRISIDGVGEMRSVNCQTHYLEYLRYGNDTIQLSPYQNTIIGKFGSGKSLLLERIRKGEEGIKNSDKYTDFYNPQGFQIFCSGNPYNSIDEMNHALSDVIKVYVAEQIEAYYYKNDLNKEEATCLFNKFNISFVPEKDVVFDFGEDKLIDAFKAFKELFDNDSHISNLNYALAFTKQKYYTLDPSFSRLKYDDALTQLSEATSISENLIKGEIDTGIKYFSEQEKEQIIDCTTLVKKRNKQIECLKLEHFEESLNSILMIILSTLLRMKTGQRLRSFKTIWTLS